MTLSWVIGTCVHVQVTTGGTYPGTPVTSSLMSPVEASYIRLEILDPAASSAVAMAALKVEFYGSVTAGFQVPVTDDRTILLIIFRLSSR